MAAPTPDVVMDALGDPTRRAVLRSLRAGPRAVGDIAATLPVSRPAVSQHLRVLKSAGLVSDRAAGTRRLYRLDPAGLLILRRELESYWDDVLAAFAAEVERAREQVKPARTADTPGPSATAQEAEQEERP